VAADERSKSVSTTFLSSQLKGFSNVANKHRSRVRVRVRVRSYVDSSRILHYVTESEARLMCGENADGSEMIGQDGQPIEPIARRLSLKKHQLTDIRMLAPVKGDGVVKTALSFADVVNNAFAKAFKVLGGPEISIRSLQRAEGKVDAWPEIYDEKAVVICAGKVHGVTFVPREMLA
jgi:hypothetical protein